MRRQSVPPGISWCVSALAAILVLPHPCISTSAKNGRPTSWHGPHNHHRHHQQQRQQPYQISREDDPQLSSSAHPDPAAFAIRHLPIRTYLRRGSALSPPPIATEISKGQSLWSDQIHDQARISALPRRRHPTLAGQRTRRPSLLARASANLADAGGRRDAGAMEGGEDDVDGERGAATGRLSLKGPILDLLTPFTEDGEVDFVAFGEYLQFLSKAGVPTVLCNGEAGEFASLSKEERRLLSEFTRKTFGGTVLNHVSASALPDVTRLISHSASKAPDSSRTVADAILLMPPYLSFGESPDEGGSEAFLRRALEGCELPVFLFSPSGNPISPGLYARLCSDFTNVSGIVDCSGDTEVFRELKRALPARQLLVSGERGAGMASGNPRSTDAFLAMKAGADACVMGTSNPLPELSVKMQECFDRGDVNGAFHAQRRLDLWSKKREAMPGACVPVVKAAIAARVPGFNPYTRPPYKELEPDVIRGIMRWVANNDDVQRLKQNAQLQKVSSQLSSVYQQTWNTVEVAALELLLEQLSVCEDRLLAFLERAKRQRAEMNGRTLMNASAGEAEAEKLLSNVVNVRVKLEEGAEEEGGTTRSGVWGIPVPSAALQAKLREAMAIAERSEEQLRRGFDISSLADAAAVKETLSYANEKFFATFGSHNNNGDVGQVRAGRAEPDGGSAAVRETSFGTAPSPGSGTLWPPSTDTAPLSSGRDVNGDVNDRVERGAYAEEMDDEFMAHDESDGDRYESSPGPADENASVQSPASSPITSPASSQMLRQPLPPPPDQVQPPQRSQRTGYVGGGPRDREMTLRDAVQLGAKGGVVFASGKGNHYTMGWGPTLDGTGGVFGNGVDVDDVGVGVRAGDVVGESRYGRLEDGDVVEADTAGENRGTAATAWGEDAYGTRGYRDTGGGAPLPPGGVSSPDGRKYGESVDGTAFDDGSDSIGGVYGSGGWWPPSTEEEEKRAPAGSSAGGATDYAEYARAREGGFGPGQTDEWQGPDQRQPQQTGADFTRGPTYGGRDYRSTTSTPRFGRNPPESQFKLDEQELQRKRRNQQQQQRQQQHSPWGGRDNIHRHKNKNNNDGDKNVAGAGSKPVTTPPAVESASASAGSTKNLPDRGAAEQAIAASQARAKSAVESERQRREQLQQGKSSRNSGNGDSSRGSSGSSKPDRGSVYGGRGADGTAAAARQSGTKKPLPEPNYGRYIPDGSEPKRSAAKSTTDYSFRSQVTAPSTRAADPPWAERVQESGGSRRGSDREESREEEPPSEEEEGRVNDYREREKDQFFRSKGIDADVDSFNWDELRRNTHEIERLQKAAVDRYWQQQRDYPDDENNRKIDYYD